jgi:hypothetical protein
MSSFLRLKDGFFYALELRIRPGVLLSSYDWWMFLFLNYSRNDGHGIRHCEVRSNPEGMARRIASFLAMTGYFLPSAFCFLPSANRLQGLKPLQGFVVPSLVREKQSSQPCPLVPSQPCPLDF